MDGEVETAAAREGDCGEKGGNLICTAQRLIVDCILMIIIAYIPTEICTMYSRYM